jgi:hypothetical protein
MEVRIDVATLGIVKYLLEKHFMKLPKMSTRYINSITKALEGDIVDLHIDREKFRPYLDKLVDLNLDSQDWVKWENGTIEHLVKTARVIEFFWQLTTAYYEGRPHAET